MVKETQGQIPKTGTHEWLKEYSYHRWEIIRRHPKYRAFCKKCSFAFDSNDPRMLDPMNLKEISLRREADSIKECFSLEGIYHPSVSFEKDRILVYGIFTKERSVEHESREVEPGLESPIWDEHYMKLRIDITKTDAQIKEEAFELINWGRDIIGAKAMKFPFKNLKQVYKVWDLREKSPTEIIKELWPKEYEIKCSEDIYQQDKKYRELRASYKKQGYKDFEDRAYYEAYHDEDFSGCIKLYMRVRDYLKRMESLFQKVKID